MKKVGLAVAAYMYPRDIVFTLLKKCINGLYSPRSETKSSKLENVWTAVTANTYPGHIVFTLLEKCINGFYSPHGDT